jgi:ABC-type transporter Mla MlaB component
MPPNILTSHRGRTLAVRLTGPLDRRLASGLFSRLLSAQSGYDELVVDLTGVDEVHDTGLAALRLLRNRARSAGKRLTVIDAYRHDSVAGSHRAATAGVPRAAGHLPWALPAHAQRVGLQRATSRIATPGRHGGIVRGTLFPRAPMSGQAGAA